MRICPKCGHIDPIHWRPASMNPEFDYAYMDTVEREVMELMKNAARGEVRQLGFYVYWISTRSNTIRRCWIEDFKMVGKRGNPQEKTESTKNSPSRRAFGVSAKGK